MQHIQQCEIGLCLYWQSSDVECNDAESQPNKSQCKVEKIKDGRLRAVSQDKGKGNKSFQEWTKELFCTLWNGLLWMKILKTGPLNNLDQ